MLASTAVLAPSGVFLAVYGSTVGRGFISDDFGWILRSRVEALSDVLRLFGESNGFYRPIVAVSFGANYRIFGTDPLGYGWTNLALAVLSAALIFVLFRSLTLGRGAAALGAGLWLLNFHGINMALLWISGRTALLLIIGVLFATISMLRGRVLATSAGLAFALFSKEEAVAVPLIWLAAYGLDLSTQPLSQRKRIALAIATIGVLAVYALLRAQSGAMTPETAPSYYRFSFALGAVGRNALEYADRAGTFAAASSLVGWLLLWPRHVRIDTRLLLFGAAWIVAGYALTLWLPVRSSLYACLPSIGAALMAAAFLEASWTAATETRRMRALAAVILIPILCAPAYLARTHRWTDLAELSTSAMHDIQSYAPHWADDTWLVFEDDRSRRANLQAAFGALIGDAVTLNTGRAFPVWVEPPLDYAALAGMTPPCETCRTVRLTLQDGRLLQLNTMEDHRRR